MHSDDEVEHVAPLASSSVDTLDDNDGTWVECCNRPKGVALPVTEVVRCPFAGDKWAKSVVSQPLPVEVFGYALLGCEPLALLGIDHAIEIVHLYKCDVIAVCE